MAAPTITAFPTPAPNRGTQDQDTFSAAVQALVNHYPTHVTEENTLGTWMNTTAGQVATNAATATTQAGIATTQAGLAADQVTLATAQKALAEAAATSAISAPGTSATSTTSLTIGTGAKSLTIQTGKSLVVGMWVVCAETSAPSTNYMAGPITAYNSGTGALDFTAVAVAGSGTIAAWTVSLTAVGGATLGANTFTGPQVFSDQILSRGMFKDCGFSFLDKGNSGTATQTLDYTAGSHQKITVTGNHTIATSNWPPTGNLGEMLLELVNGAAFTITWPTINWIKDDGTTTTTFSANGVTLQSSGTDWVCLWTRDAGTTIYGKVIR